MGSQESDTTEPLNHINKPAIVLGLMTVTVADICWVLAV